MATALRRRSTPARSPALKFFAWPDDGTPPPAAGQLFNFAYHEEHDFGPDSRKDTMTTQLGILPAGTLWWIAGSLHVEAHANVGGSRHGEF